MRNFFFFLIFIPIILPLEELRANENWESQGKLADSLRRSGNYEMSIPIYEDFLSHLKDNSEDYFKYKIRIGLSYFMDGEDSMALSSYNEVIKKIKSDNLSIYKAHAYNNTGLVYDNNGLYRLSIKAYKNAQELYAHLGDSALSDITKMNIGIVLKKQGDYKSALIELISCTIGFEGRGDLIQLGEAYNTIGNVQELMGANDKAKEFYQKSINIRKTINDQYGLANSYNNIGNILQEEYNIDSAIICYNAALKLMEAFGERNKGITLHNLGSCYLMRGNNSEAKLFFQRALETKQLFNDQSSQITTLQSLANIALIEGQLNKALTYINASKKAISNETSRKLLKEQCNIKKIYFKKTGQLDSALFYLELVNQMENEINKIAYLNEIALLQEAFEADSRKREITNLEKKNSDKNVQLAQNSEQINQLGDYVKIIGIALCSVIILGLILFYFQKQRLKYQRIKAELDGVEAEKQRLSMELHEAAGSRLRNVKSQLQNFIKEYSNHSISDKIIPLHEKISEATEEIIMISHSLYHPKIENGIFTEIISDFLFDWFEDNPFSRVDKITGLEILNSFKNSSKSHIYRFFQEVLTNIKRHASASEVTILVVETKGQIALSVIDNGIGITSAMDGGIGIQNLEKRAQIMSGTLLIKKNTVKRGTIVSLSLPIKENQKHV